MAGAIGVALLYNLVSNQIEAYIEDSVLSSADDILIRAKGTDTLDTLCFSGSVAIAGGGPGGALAGCGAQLTNTLMSEVSAYLKDTVATAEGNIDLQAVSDSEIKKSQAIGVAVAGSLGSASVAVSLVDNQISNTVQAYVTSPYDYTVQDRPALISEGKRIRLDNGEIYERDASRDQTHSMRGLAVTLTGQYCTGLMCRTDCQNCDSVPRLASRHGYITTPSAVGTAWERDLHGGADMPNIPYNVQRGS